MDLFPDSGYPPNLEIPRDLAEFVSHSSMTLSLQQELILKPAPDYIHDKNLLIESVACVRDHETTNVSELSWVPSSE